MNRTPNRYVMSDLLLDLGEEHRRRAVDVPHQLG